MPPNLSLFSEEEIEPENGEGKATKVETLVLQEQLKNTNKLVSKLDHNLEQLSQKLDATKDRSERIYDDLSQKIEDQHEKVQGSFEKVLNKIESFREKEVEQDIRLERLSTKQKILLAIGGPAIIAILGGLIKVLFFSGKL